MLNKAQRPTQRNLRLKLEGLVAAEVHLLGVAVGARVGELPVEAEEDGEAWEDNAISPLASTEL